MLNNERHEDEQVRVRIPLRVLEMLKVHAKAHTCVPAHAPVGALIRAVMDHQAHLLRESNERARLAEAALIKRNVEYERLVNQLAVIARMQNQPEAYVNREVYANAVGRLVRTLRNDDTPPTQSWLRRAWARTREKLLTRRS